MVNSEIKKLDSMEDKTKGEIEVKSFVSAIKESNSYLAYDTKRVDYTISDAEIELLEKSGENHWKEIFFTSIGVFIPSLIGLFIEWRADQSNYTKEIFIYSIFLAISVVAGALSFWGWKKSLDNFKKIINKVKSRELLQVGSD